MMRAAMDQKKHNSLEQLLLCKTSLEVSLAAMRNFGFLEEQRCAMYFLALSFLLLFSFLFVNTRFFSLFCLGFLVAM